MTSYSVTCQLDFREAAVPAAETYSAKIKTYESNSTSGQLDTVYLVSSQVPENITLSESATRVSLTFLLCVETTLDKCTGLYQRGN